MYSLYSYPSQTLFYSCQSILVWSLEPLILVVLNAIVEGAKVFVGHLVGLAAIGTHFVYPGVVMTIHFAIPIAILIELLHVVLNRVGCTVGIIGTMDERMLGVGCFAIYGQFAGIHPIGPSDAEQSADTFLRVGANGGRIAAANCLADAVQAQLSDRLVQHMTCISQMRSSYVEYYPGQQLTLSTHRNGRQHHANQAE